MEQIYVYSVTVIVVTLFVLFIAGIIWAEFGIPMGIMLSLVKALRKMPYTWKSMLFWSFGGVLLILFTVGIFLLLAYILSLIGFPLHALYS